MPCSPALHRFRRGAPALATILAFASCATLAERVRGTSPYRVPAFVLAYPDRDAPLPADRPVVLLRFAPREADDPIDVASFRATADGVDRTRGFRATSTEAWGTLADSAANAGVSSPAPVTAGPHTLAVRICTARGACGSFSAVIDVRPWGQGTAMSSRPAPDRGGA